MKQHTSWRRILLWLSGLLLAAQSLVIGVLAVASAIRKRRAPPASFPHDAADRQEKATRCGWTYGQDLYNAMLAAIDDARETIFLETFIWKSDRRRTDQAAAGAQGRRRRQGLRDLRWLRQHGRTAKVQAFRPRDQCPRYRTLDRVWYIFYPRRYARYYRKLLVVDHAIAFLGGFNIGKLYATEWRDSTPHSRAGRARYRTYLHRFLEQQSRATPRPPHLLTGRGLDESNFIATIWRG